MSYPLTDEMNHFWGELIAFLGSSDRTIALTGTAGVGKSTFTKYIIDNIDLLNSHAYALGLVSKENPYSIQLSAMTHKAAEIFIRSGYDCATVHATFCIRMQKDYRTNQLHPVKNHRAWDRCELTNDRDKKKLLIIDEASMITPEVNEFIAQGMSELPNLKVLFIGDPYQLLGVKGHAKTQVFNFVQNHVELTKVVRQDNTGGIHPITKLALQFKDTVRTGQFNAFTPDGDIISHVDADTFEKLLKEEFGRSDYRASDARVLAWKNETALAYERMIHTYRGSTETIEAGTTMICNEYVKKPYMSESARSLTSLFTDSWFGTLFFVTDQSISNNSEVMITGVVPRTLIFKDDPSKVYSGYIVTIGKEQYLCFKDSKEIRKTMLRLKPEMEVAINTFMDLFVDLRHVYASTVDKSQGDTFKRVYIDLGDIAKCHNGDRLARMLYVAISRAQEKVIFTGDVV